MQKNHKSRRIVTGSRREENLQSRRHAHKASRKGLRQTSDNSCLRHNTRLRRKTVGRFARPLDGRRNQKRNLGGKTNGCRNHRIQRQNRQKR